VRLRRWATPASLHGYRDLAASFLAFFAALRSFGVLVGCFLPSLTALRSLDIQLASSTLNYLDALSWILPVNERPLAARDDPSGLLCCCRRQPLTATKAVDEQELVPQVRTLVRA